MTCDGLGQLGRQIHALVADGIDHDGAVYGLRVAGIAVQAEEQVAALRGLPTGHQSKVLVALRPGCDHLESVLLQLGLEIEVERPRHVAFPVSRRDVGVVVVLSKMPSV